MNIKPEIQNSKSLIVIAGPTAVGKTAHAIEVAEYFNTVILSVDSRQCYKELNIGVARPSEDELAKVMHHFIASHSIHDDINAAWYETYALNLLNDLFKKHDTIVVTGGTGLYLKALIEGLDTIPKINQLIRNNIIKNYNAQGIEWLQQQLKAQDPLFFNEGEMQNPQRMMRALEVVQAAGQSILSYRNKEKPARPFHIYQLGLKMPRAILYDRINARVNAMILAGLENEAKSLYEYRNLNALQTVGYKELFQVFDGKSFLQNAVEQIKQNTRRYAKRQMTWFMKQQNFKWIDVSEGKTIIPEIIKSINNNKDGLKETQQ